MSETTLSAEPALVAPQNSISLGRELLGTERILLRKSEEGWAIIKWGDLRFPFHFISVEDESSDKSDIFHRGRNECVEYKLVNWKHALIALTAEATIGYLNDQRPLYSVVMIQRAGDTFIIDVQLLAGVKI